MKSPVRSIIDLVSSYSLYDWIRFIITILFNVCAIYTVFYGFTHFFETHSIAFLVTGFLAFFTIYRLYEMLKGENDEHDEKQKDERSKKDARRSKP